MSLQKQIIEALHVRPEVDPQQEIRKRVDFLKEYLIKARARGFVLGISGGQDSTLAGKLAQLAAEELRSEGKEAKFVAVRLPYAVQKDEDDARLALDFIRPDESVVFNIQPVVDTFNKQFEEMSGRPLLDFNKGNVKARIRMITQYAIAGEDGLLVIGTDHAAEAVTGFYTKYGDGGADLMPLAGLNKRQGREMLKALNAEERLYMKVPTADLLDNNPLQADETEIGISYAAIDDYLEGKEIPKEDAEKIEARYKVSEHKRQIPATMFDSWWEK
ncbi:ammonia-dependent NAD(+) synthetase [Bacillus sp. REN3]|uniref:ammonia-dependent NAD(+) synthetase n=1 Tax=Bacillus sp. REN3 TaxID=2802440 RepID=UPI001AED9520|nr:ammonia-dependent NAD(+) synthetase [Bacillus sp. REN3]